MSGPRALNAIPVFQVASVASSIRWYADVLDWQQGFVWPEDSDDPEYGSVCRDDAVIHLSRCSEPAQHNAHAYVLTRDTDVYAELVRQRGATFEFGPETTDYGMREFSLRDPDGNTLNFGQGTSDED